MAPLEGKGALVTGGSRGIGRAIVERLSTGGATVVFAYARDEDAAAQTEQAVRAAGGIAHAIRADLADEAAVEDLIQQASQRLDGLDILVNNAAAATPRAAIAETDVEVWDEAMTTNARAAFLLVRHAARSMRDGGRIVNISTLNTIRPAAGIASYVASKAAVEQLTRVAAIELGPRGITANVVSPGFTDTDLLRGASPKDALPQLAKMSPLGRLGQPQDIADVVATLTGPDGGWITGQTIHANGGVG
jgi:3-oxoacyl-[acyl-carrier protein] reductase